MAGNDSINTDTPQFPLWLEEIVPIKSAISYINRKGFRDDVADILAVACQRLDNAKEQGKQISKPYIFVTLRNLAYDTYRKQESERKKKEKLKSQAKKNPEKKSIITDSEDEIVIDLINEAIKELDLRRRVITKLRCHSSHKFTFKEIGSIIGYSESTAREEFKSVCKIIKSYVKNRLTIYH